MNHNSLLRLEHFLLFFFSLSAVAIMLIYICRHDDVREMINNSPIFIAFQNHWHIIFAAVSSTIAVTIPMALELFLDVLFNWKCAIDDKMERLFIILVVIIPGALFLFQDMTDIPYIFSCIHAIQYVGCFGAVLSLCHKLVPSHFTTKRMIFVHFFFSLASIISMGGFGLPLYAWQNMAVLVCIPSSIFAFCYITLKWIKSLKIKINYMSKNRLSSLSINESCCMLYIISTLFTIIIIPGVAASTCLLAWEFYNLAIVLIFIYSLVGFCLFPSCVPGRIARYYHSEQIIKRATLRYLSHEIRSPLNVVCNGITFVKQDLIGCSPEIMENLNDIEFASESAVSILNDFLDFDHIGSGLFRVLPAQITISNAIKTMIKPLGIFARQKRVEFIINNYLDSEWCNNFSLFLDKNKMIQVFRNIVVNAIQYTPVYGAITITIQSISRRRDRRESTLETFDTFSTLQGPLLQNVESPGNYHRLRNSISTTIGIGNNDTILSPIHNPTDDIHQSSLFEIPPQPDDFDLIIEVTDTGTGIPEHVRHQIFGEFFQFDPDKLQGGGGSGLGLWICKEIVQQHKGSITFQPGPNNIGTTVTFRLQAYRGIHHGLESLDVGPELDTIPSLSLIANPLIRRESYDVEDDDDSQTNEADIGNLKLDFPAMMSMVETGVDETVRIGVEGVDTPLACFGYGDTHNQDKSVTTTTSSSSASSLTQIKTPISTSMKVLHSRLQCLVVDDSDISRRMVRRSVQRVLAGADCEGTEVDFDDADDGLSAIELVRTSLSTTTLSNNDKETENDKNKDKEMTTTDIKSKQGVYKKGYDIIFMDNIMLKMNGPEASKIIRDMGYQSRIIGVTGNTLPKDIDEFLHLGADQVLTKPVDLKLLKEVLVSVLSNKYK